MIIVMYILVGIATTIGAYMCYEIKVMSAITVGVHKCRSPLSHHHPGQPVHRLNTPSK